MSRMYKGYVLDPFQRRAIQGIEEGRSVVVAAPTGCGKTLIAEYAIERAIQQERRVVYTSPIKALSNQKFRDFGAAYPDKVGIMTGDVTINPGAPVLIMTTEIFRNTIFDEPERLAGIEYCIFDEIHYLDDPERGTVWEESIIFAPEQIRFLCLSATIANLDEFTDWIRWVRGYELTVIREERRPVPLEHRFYLPEQKVVDLEGLQSAAGSLRKRTREHDRMDLRRGRRGRQGHHGHRGRHGGGDRPGRRPRPRKASGVGLLELLAAREQLPAIYFVFNRRDTEALARAFAGRDLLSMDEHKRLARYLQLLAETFRMEEALEDTGLATLLERGVAFHHAGLLPTLKEVVERLFSTGLIKVLFATETFALGVNMPARAVVFDSLTKYNGQAQVPLMVREYQQMAGRAGRRGIDAEGFVYGIVEESVDDYEVGRRLATGQVEDIRSQFGLTYASLLCLYERMGERVVQAASRSFAAFQAERRGGGTGTAGRTYKGMVEQIRARLEFLRRAGYVRKDKLTDRGTFASRIQGHEIALTELYFKGELEDLSPRQLALVFGALVFEPRRDQLFRTVRRDELGFSRKRVTKLVQKLRMEELRLGIQTLIKAPDFRASPLLLGWAGGRTWEQLDEDAEMSDGDRVRVLRQTVQLLRQFAESIRGEGRVEERVREAMRSLNRDQVDAEAQLRQGEALDRREDPPGR